jgi:heme/copper-type cytochrome/quinol oxidase subunit 2
MDFLNNEALTQGVKFAVLLISLFIALVLVLYNWLYLVRVFSSHKETDLHPPKNISTLVKASIFTALFTVVLIIFFFATSLY